jgi:hypothetical protein
MWFVGKMKQCLLLPCPTGHSQLNLLALGYHPANSAHIHNSL